MKVELMQARFNEIQQIFEKKKSWDAFLTEQYVRIGCSYLFNVLCPLPDRLINLVVSMSDY